LCCVVKIVVCPTVVYVMPLCLSVDLEIWSIFRIVLK